MKYLVTILAVLLTLGFIGTADAFHNGGVAHCDGCHSMHQSPDNPVTGVDNSRLLIGSDESSTCLNCHEGSGGYHIADATGLSNMGGGGDFGWLKNGWTVVMHGTPHDFAGDNAGHNIVAFDQTYTADPDNTTAPGGTVFGGYSAGNLHCTSCHDPHGQKQGGTANNQDPISVSGSYGDPVPANTMAGNYRLLGDSFYVPTGESTTFANDAPIALTQNCRPGSYGCDTAYGSGMSEWCRNCHDDYNGGGANNRHPAPQSLNGLGSNYNSYVKTGDFTGGVGTAYDELVPIETGTADQSTLDPDSTTGYQPGGQVMCLTCHRAHASAHNNSARWDFEVELLEESNALLNTGLPATAAIYYDSTGTIDIVARYGAYQRSLCNKCHVQD